MQRKEAGAEGEDPLLLLGAEEGEEEAHPMMAAAAVAAVADRHWRAAQPLEAAGAAEAAPTLPLSSE